MISHISLKNIYYNQQFKKCIFFLIIIEMLSTIGLMGGIIGRSGSLYFIKKYNRASFVVFMLTIVLVLSFLALIYYISTEDPDFEFHNLC